MTPGAIFSATPHVFADQQDGLDCFDPPASLVLTQIVKSASANTRTELAWKSTSAEIRKRGVPRGEMTRQSAGVSAESVKDLGQL